MQRRRHYWRLDTKSITLFNDETTSRYHKEISLGDIISIDELTDPCQVADGRGQPIFAVTLESECVRL